MKTYVINAENIVTVHANGEAVAMSADRRTFATLDGFEAAVKERALGELVALWNSLAGIPPFDDLNPVAKFTDRKTGGCGR